MVSRGFFDDTAIFIIVLCFVYYSVTLDIFRLLPTLLAWLFMRKYHIKLKIGRIAVPKLILKDVSLSKDRYSIVSCHLFTFVVPYVILVLSRVGCLCHMS